METSRSALPGAARVAGDSVLGLVAAQEYAAVCVRNFRQLSRALSSTYLASAER